MSISVLHIVCCIKATKTILIYKYVLITVTKVTPAHEYL